jgi:AraC-like DNA-binding protein
MDDEAELLLQNVPRINLDQVYENNEVSMANKNNKLVGRIKQAMEEQYLYKETGFTITNLAAILTVPEQRLRTTINRKLVFQNFNQFINHYRIREATQLLSNSEEPISKIAMEVGYNSLSAFNKSFKESHGVPPRQYRTVADYSIQE